MSEKTVPNDRGDDTSSETSAKRCPRPRLIFAVIVPGALLFLGGVVVFGVFDGMALLAGLTTPPITRGMGQVMYQGKPLPNAHLLTRPVRGGLKGATGFCDEEGRFELMTDIQGQYIKGAYAGEHVVTVVAYRGAAAPFCSIPPDSRAARPAPSPFVGAESSDQFDFTSRRGIRERQGASRRPCRPPSVLNRAGA